MRPRKALMRARGFGCVRVGSRANPIDVRSCAHPPTAARPLHRTRRACPDRKRPLPAAIAAPVGKLIRHAPRAAAPLLDNYVLLSGGMNYMFGIGLALWATAAWITLRERAWPWRMTVSAALAIALCVCHLCALGVYGLALLAVELGRLWSRRT